MSPRYDAGSFRDATSAEREVLCRTLAAEITGSIRSSGDFWRVTRGAVEAPSALGHDLWSFDESDDFHAWCPSYERPMPGIVLTFRVPDMVEVAWSEA